MYESKLEDSEKLRFIVSTFLTLLLLVTPTEALAGADLDNYSAMEVYIKVVVAYMEGSAGITALAVELTTAGILAETVD